ncbi:SDR family NAD(P)-dependent oxidoreductase [Pseudoxanthomonas sp. 10H]|uniref:SDR family NAD(P)-dependent oxidoreductase n=1 Tax=Pseudoxanthomonas sp. 10H TaxID=3242729 RepID=UPI003557B4E7
MILVTGASRGLGAAVCDHLRARGKDVLGIARGHSDAMYPRHEMDVTSYEGWRDLASRLRKDKVEVEALLNVAGVASMNLAVTTPEAVTRRVIETNLMGSIFACQTIAPLMLRNKKGVIINFSTIAVHLGLKGESIYVASKAGVEGFSRAFAREMADFGITVNCIAPGPIRTGLLKGISDAQIDAIVQQQIFRRVFDSDAVCDTVDMLLSGSARAVTGQVIHIGGA